MVGLIDVARSRAEDPDALGRVPNLPDLPVQRRDLLGGGVGGLRSVGECVCSACEERWRVYLAPEQALRFGLMDHANAA